MRRWQRREIQRAERAARVMDHRAAHAHAGGAETQRQKRADRAGAGDHHVRVEPGRRDDAIAHAAPVNSTRAA